MKIDKNLKIKVGKKMELLRKEKNLTIKEVAKVFEVTNKTLRSWEKGKTSPELKKYLKICSFFQVSLDYLLGLSENRYYRGKYRK